MALTLDFCKDEDFTPMMDLMFDAMAGESQFVNAVYPHSMTAQGREKHRRMFLYLKNVDPSQRWLKVTDTASGQIIGVAQWNVYDGPKPPEVELDGPPGTWDADDDKEWAQAMFRSYMEDRRRIIRQATGPVMSVLTRASRKDMELSGENPDRSVELATGGYLAALGVYHELHCLRKIRWYIYRDIYYPNMTDNVEEYYRGHIDHCLETLRISSMCKADIGLYTFAWKSTKDSKPATKSNSERECVNWDALASWAQQRAVGWNPSLIAPKRSSPIKRRLFWGRGPTFG